MTPQRELLTLMAIFAIVCVLVAGAIGGIEAYLNGWGETVFVPCPVVVGTSG